MAAGLAATLILTGLMYLGPLIGIRTWNIPAIVGSAMSFNEHVTPTINPGPYGVGFVLYVIFGIFVFPSCYAYWVFSYLPGATWMRGLLYGGLIWLLLQVFLMPMIGQGAFDVRGPAMGVELLSQLVMWLAYGLVLGLLAGTQQMWRKVVHRPEEHAV